MARKKKKEKATKSGLMVMVVSLNLILLIFFVYLNSIGVDDDKKVKKVLASLSGTFGMLPRGLHLSEGKTLLIPGAPVVSSGFSSLSVVREFTRLIREKEFDQDAYITKEGDDLIIHMSEGAFFKSGHAKLKDEARRLLDEVTPLLLKYPYAVRIEGHTDNIPVSTAAAKFPSNWDLSAARATSVLRYFVEVRKIPVERMMAVGFGEFRPLVPNDRPENQEKNRRVRIVLLEAAI